MAAQALAAQPGAPARATLEMERGEVVLRILQAAQLRQVRATEQGDVVVLEPVRPEASRVLCGGRAPDPGRTEVILSSPEQGLRTTRIVIVTGWGDPACRSTGLWEQELLALIRGTTSPSAVSPEGAGPLGLGQPSLSGPFAGQALGTAEAEHADPSTSPLYFLAGMVLGPIGVAVAYADATDQTPQAPPARVADLIRANGEVFAASYATAFRQRLSERRRAGALGTSIGGWALSTTLVVLYLQAQQRRAEEDIRRILTGAQVTVFRIPF